MKLTRSQAWISLSFLCWITMWEEAGLKSPDSWFMSPDPELVIQGLINVKGRSSDAGKGREEIKMN